MLLHFSTQAFAAAALLGSAVFLTGCASDGSGGSAAARPSLPDALSARWTPPVFATRPVDGERAAVLDACVAAANSLGYSVARFDGARGLVRATRREGSAFDGAVETTLEINVTTLGPGVSQVAAVLRQAEEGSDRDGRSIPVSGSVLVRDRVPYDVFFERVAVALRPAS